MFAIAVDIGGAHAECALVQDRAILARRRISIAPTSFRAILPSLEQLVVETAGETSVPLHDCSGVVLGFPGIVDSRQRFVVATNEKFNDALQVDLQAWSKTAFNLPLFLENDARLALIGEHYCGAAEGSSDAVLVTIGTGIGGAAMLDGKPIRGHYDQAGCLGGHLPIVFDGRKCTCGNIGCAEAEASTWALPQILREWPDFEQSRLATEQVLDFSVLFSAADAGDAVARGVLNRCFRIWAVLAVSLIHAYSPSVLVFGGGVVARAADFLPVIRAYVEQHAWTPRGHVVIAATTLGPAAPLYGAIPLIMEIVH